MRVTKYISGNEPPHSEAETALKDNVIGRCNSSLKNPKKQNVQLRPGRVLHCLRLRFVPYTP